jgi:hypothetical protein
MTTPDGSTFMRLSSVAICEPCDESISRVLDEIFAILTPKHGMKGSMDARLRLVQQHVGQDLRTLGRLVTMPSTGTSTHAGYVSARVSELALSARGT